jgi:hypothetical protein
MYSVRFSYKRRGNIWIPIATIILYGKEKQLVTVVSMKVERVVL